MSQITHKAAVLLQAMRAKIILPTLNHLSATTGRFFVRPDLDKETKEELFTKDLLKSSNPTLAVEIEAIHNDTILNEIVVCSLFELATGNAKTRKANYDLNKKFQGYTEEFHKPDFQAIKFYLENVDPANWKDKTSTGTTDELIRAANEAQERRAREANAANQ